MAGKVKWVRGRRFSRHTCFLTYYNTVGMKKAWVLPGSKFSVSKFSTTGIDRKKKGEKLIYCNAKTLPYV